MLQENLISQSAGETNSMTFSHFTKFFVIPSEGTINWLEQEYGFVASIIHLILVFGFTCSVEGA